jgi:hypothetical protein
MRLSSFFCAAIDGYQKQGNTFIEIPDNIVLLSPEKKNNPKPGIFARKAGHSRS